MSEPYPITQSSAITLLSCANAAYVFSTSVVGLSLLLTSLPHIILGGVLATLIDIDVNRITLRNGFKKMLEADYLLLRLARQELLNLANDIDKTATSDASYNFLAHYRNVYDRYQRLKGAPLRHASLLHAARRELQSMERYAAQGFLATSSPNDPLNSGLFANSERNAAFSHNFRLKQRLIRASWLINLTAGLGTALITAFTAHIAVSDIGLLLVGTSIAAGPAVIIPIAVAAGAWYAITTYNNLFDIIASETIQRKWAEIRRFLARSDAEHPWRLRCQKVLLVLGLGLILALGLFMTLATAGTWWYGVKHGARLLPLLNRIAKTLVAIVVPCVAFAAFLFNFNNFLESTWRVQKILASNALREKFKAASHCWHHETWLERLNLFRVIKLLLEAPIKVFLFIGHILSVGAITDRMPHVPPAVPMLVGATCEAGEDLHFLLKKDPGVLTYLVAFALLPITFLDACWRFALHRSSDPTKQRFSYYFDKCLGIETEDKASQAPLPQRHVDQTFMAAWREHRLKEGMTELRNRYRFSLLAAANNKRKAIETYLAGGTLEALKEALAHKRFGCFATRGNTFGATRLDELLATAA